MLRGPGGGWGGEMMEINGEWQLRGLNSLQSESMRRREVTAARCHSEKSPTRL